MISRDGRTSKIHKQEKNGILRHIMRGSKYSLLQANMMGRIERKQKQSEEKDYLGKKKILERWQASEPNSFSIKQRVERSSASLFKMRLPEFLFVFKVNNSPDFENK